MKEYDEGQVSNVEVMFQIKSKRMKAKYDEVLDRSTDIALHYARAKLLEYSAKHPRRECCLCVAMGSAVLYVPNFSPFYGESYRFEAHSEYAKVPSPKFLGELSDLGGSLGMGYDSWFGPIRMVALGGKLISCKTDW